MAKDFLAVMECFNLTQFVNASTRSKGHTLDLVIANESLLLSILVFLTILQYFFNLDLSVQCVPMARTVKFYMCKSIDQTKYATAVGSSLTELGSVTLDDDISQLNNVLATNLDLFAQQITAVFD